MSTTDSIMLNDQPDDFNENQLLEFLDQFSNSLLSKSKYLLDSLDVLEADVLKATVVFQNTSNEFSMLGNFQFIENRVYEDSHLQQEFEEKKFCKNKNKNKAKKVLDSEEGMKLALSYGMSALPSPPAASPSSSSPSTYSHYQELCRQKPLHLPYIIGTSQFTDSIDGYNIPISNVEVEVEDHNEDNSDEKFEDFLTSYEETYHSNTTSDTIPTDNNSSNISNVPGLSTTTHKDNATTVKPESAENHPGSNGSDSNNNDNSTSTTNDLSVDRSWMTPHDRLQHDLLARLKLGRNKNAASTTATSSEDNPVEANDGVHKEASQALTNTTSQISNNINNNNNNNNNSHIDTPAHQTTAAKTPAIIMPFTASDLQKKIKGVPIATVDHATSSVIKEKGGEVEEEGDMFALSSPDDPYGLFASIPSSSSSSSSSSTQKKKSFSGNEPIGVVGKSAAQSDPLEALFGSQRNTAAAAASTAAAAATSTAAASSHLLSVTSGSQNTTDRSGNRDALLFGLDDGVGSGYQSGNKNPLPASSNKMPQITSHATNTNANSFQSTSSSSSSSSIDSLLFPKQPLSTKPSKPATGGGLFDDDEDDGQSSLWPGGGLLVAPSSLPASTTLKSTNPTADSGNTPLPSTANNTATNNTFPNQSTKSMNSIVSAPAAPIPTTLAPPTAPKNVASAPLPASKAFDLFGDEEDSNDLRNSLFSNKVAAPLPAAVKPVIKAQVNNNSSKSIQKTVNLFGDDDDDVDSFLFGSKNIPPQISSSSSRNKTNTSMNSSKNSHLSDSSTNTTTDKISANIIADIPKDTSTHTESKNDSLSHSSNINNANNNSNIASMIDPLKMLPGAKGPTVAVGGAVVAGGGEGVGVGGGEVTFPTSSTAKENVEREDEGNDNNSTSNSNVNRDSNNSESIPNNPLFGAVKLPVLSPQSNDMNVTTMSTPSISAINPLTNDISTTKGKDMTSLFDGNDDDNYTHKDPLFGRTSKTASTASSSSSSLVSQGATRNTAILDPFAQSPPPLGTGRATVTNQDPMSSTVAADFQSGGSSSNINNANNHSNIASMIDPLKMLPGAKRPTVAGGGGGAEGAGVGEETFPTNLTKETKNREDEVNNSNSNSNVHKNSNNSETISNNPLFGGVKLPVVLSKSSTTTAESSNNISGISPVPAPLSTTTALTSSLFTDTNSSISSNSSRSVGSQRRALGLFDEDEEEERDGPLFASHKASTADLVPSTVVHPVTSIKEKEFPVNHVEADNSIRSNAKSGVFHLFESDDLDGNILAPASQSEIIKPMVTATANIIQTTNTNVGNTFLAEAMDVFAATEGNGSRLSRDAETPSSNGDGSSKQEVTSGGFPTTSSPSSTNTSSSKLFDAEEGAATNDPVDPIFGRKMFIPSRSTSAPSESNTKSSLSNQSTSVTENLYGIPASSYSEKHRFEKDAQAEGEGKKTKSNVNNNASNSDDRNSEVNSVGGGSDCGSSFNDVVHNSYIASTIDPLKMLPGAKRPTVAAAGVGVGGGEVTFPTSSTAKENIEREDEGNNNSSTRLLSGPLFGGVNLLPEISQPLHPTSKSHTISTTPHTSTSSTANKRSTATAAAAVSIGIGMGWDPLSDGFTKTDVIAVKDNSSLFDNSNKSLPAPPPVDADVGLTDNDHVITIKNIKFTEQIPELNNRISKVGNPQADVSDAETVTERATKEVIGHGGAAAAAAAAVVTSKTKLGEGLTARLNNMDMSQIGRLHKPPSLPISFKKLEGDLDHSDMSSSDRLNLQPQPSLEEPSGVTGSTSSQATDNQLTRVAIKAKGRRAPSRKDFSTFLEPQQQQQQPSSPSLIPIGLNSLTSSESSRVEQVEGVGSQGGDAESPSLLGVASHSPSQASRTDALSWLATEAAVAVAVAGDTTSSRSDKTILPTAINTASTTSATATATMFEPLSSGATPASETVIQSMSAQRSWFDNTTISNQIAVKATYDSIKSIDSQLFENPLSFGIPQAVVPVVEPPAARVTSTLTESSILSESVAASSLMSPLVTNLIPSATSTVTTGHTRVSTSSGLTDDPLSLPQLSTNSLQPLSSSPPPDPIIIDSNNTTAGKMKKLVAIQSLKKGLFEDDNDFFGDAITPISLPSKTKTRSSSSGSSRINTITNTSNPTTSNEISNSESVVDVSSTPQSIRGTTGDTSDSRKKTSITSGSRHSLFDDENDDDNLNFLSTATIKNKRPATLKSRSLFDDDD